MGIWWHLCPNTQTNTWIQITRVFAHREPMNWTTKRANLITVANVCLMTPTIFLTRCCPIKRRALWRRRSKNIICNWKGWSMVQVFWICYIIIVIISNVSGIDSCIEGQEILYVFFKRWGDRAGKKLKKQHHHQPSTTQACSRHWKFLFQIFWRRSYVWSVELPPYLNRIGNRSVGFGWRLMILRLAYQNGRREEFCNYKAWQ